MLPGLDVYSVLLKGLRASKNAGSDAFLRAAQVDERVKGLRQGRIDYLLRRFP
jgi:hypothetical protein